ncbi:4Fe-4S single cluster domain-containing protein [Mycobacterium sp. ITM-2016-00316]|uniref:4Fe-4S single cluster domain-containing protein n=1 Tax=Mycobacterium sp. ITM-2016-00316 TaxID=2099695 RepID=UPI000CF9F2D6|nr:4Fe-4S single cluster domain-containing protein [Mycobacterium sp. ITM-2016-00316]WNG81152.1 4Fe-4S single cluster domain-containing protein [Mycobacterium sp. ITM-2016-00316]
MKIQLSRTHYPVTALGPGRRAGIWMQGCTFACPGCVSRDTWPAEGGSAHAVEDIVHWIGHLCGRPGGLDGVTITGGEPSDQPAALQQLVRGLAGLRADGAFDGDVLCYNGCELEEFLDRCPWAADGIDALITGLFRVEQPTDLVWRGSANQRLVALTERGRRVYADHMDRSTANPQMQFTVSGGKVWMIGIPRRGDLRRLELSLRSDGVALEEPSWRP